MSLPVISASVLTGKKISLKRSLPEDILRLMEIEADNNHYVSQYSSEKHHLLLNDPNYMHLSVVRKDTEQLVGLVLLFGMDDRDNVLEFRRIAIQEKGVGFGREAIHIIKRICFEELKFHRLWLDVYDDNARAIGLYESEGFILDGILRENVRLGDGFRSLRIYSVLEQEYKPSVPF
jgi:diamine N-acetyltransferase